MDAGIIIKRNPTRHMRDISFRSNDITTCLRIPPITIYSSTKAMLLNLIAYEMSPDVPHDFISYLRLLDSLIDHADDVRELQSIGILQNNLDTHEEVTIFFNTVSTNVDMLTKTSELKFRSTFRVTITTKRKFCLRSFIPYVMPQNPGVPFITHQPWNASG